LSEHAAGLSGCLGRKAGGECLEGKRLEGITTEDRRCFIECAVAGGQASSQVVIVHRWQIIVHQRVGMNHFDGDCCRNGLLPGAPTGPGSLKGECRPQSFARRQEHMSHGGDQTRSGFAGEGQ
jgi:hypothetical protein